MRNLVLALLLVPACASASDATPEAVVSALWHALSHGPGQSADVAGLERIFHDDAVVFGSRYGDGEPRLARMEADAFVESQRTPQPRAFHECEIARAVQVFDRFATVYSVVESRTDRAAAAPDFIGVNSLQLYRQGDAWKILSLYYHVGPKDLPVPVGGGTSGRCLDGPHAASPAR